MANLEQIVIGGNPAPETLPDAPDSIETMPDGSTRVKPEAVDQDPNKKPAAEAEALPEGFKTTADLAKAYQELRTKMSKEGAPKDLTPEAAEKLVTDAGLDLDKLSEEYVTNGSLTDESYKALEAKGIGREQVDNYIKGQEAVAKEFVADVQRIAGGEAELKAVIDWAGKNLSDDEAAAYNQALATGNAALAKLLMTGITAKYHAAEGSEPSLITGDGNASGRGVKPFLSAAEIAAAFQDQRYKDGDKAYHAEVRRRMAATEEF